MLRSRRQVALRIPLRRPEDFRWPHLRAGFPFACDLPRAHFGTGTPGHSGQSPAVVSLTGVAARRTPRPRARRVLAPGRNPGAVGLRCGPRRSRWPRLCRSQQPWRRLAARGAGRAQIAFLQGAANRGQTRRELARADWRRRVGLRAVSTGGREWRGRPVTHPGGTLHRSVGTDSRQATPSGGRRCRLLPERQPGSR